MPIVRGTLNIDVGPLKLLSTLGDPSFTCEDDHRLGPLRWWPVLLTFDRRSDGSDGANISDVHGGGTSISRAVSLPSLDPFLAYYVRHERSRMRHVEVCSDVHFRSIGIETGDLVTVTPVLTPDT